MLIVMPFEPQLDRTSFSCGKPDLDEWLHRLAGQQERENSGRTTYILDEREACIAGFFTLVTYRLEVEDLKYGFRRFADHSLRLFMTAKDLRATFASAVGEAEPT